MSLPCRHDAAGRLGMIEHAAGATMLQRYVYALDANGNRTEVVHNGGTERYVLDRLDRITEAEYADGEVVEYAYDPNGNRIEQRVDGAMVAAYAYDAADQLLSDGSIAYVYDGNGNLTEAGSDDFVWDWDDRLTEVTAGGQTTTYTYDTDGVRSGRTNGGVTTGYLWDREDASGLPQLVDDGTQAYLHAGGVLAGIDQASGDATYLLVDGIGSVRGRTDEAGALVGTADFDVFGVGRGASGVGGTYGFAGEQRDPATGLSDLRARQYAPGLGRFLSSDPVRPSGGGTQGWQPYAYAGNNSTTNVDPSGWVGGAYDVYFEMSLHLSVGAAVGGLAGMLAAPFAATATGTVAAGGAVSPVFGVTVLPAMTFTIVVVLFAVLGALIGLGLYCAKSGRCGDALELDGVGSGLAHMVGGTTGSVSISASVTAATACVAGLAALATTGPLGLFGLPGVAIASGCPHVPEPPSCDAGQVVDAAMSAADFLISRDPFAFLDASVSAMSACGGDGDCDPEAEKLRMKPGSAGGPTAGELFPEAVKTRTLRLNPDTCVYCRMKTDKPQVDHIIPRSRGGNATDDNAQTVCRHCNSMKRDRDFPLKPPPRFRGLWPPAWWPRWLIGGYRCDE